MYRALPLVAVLAVAGCVTSTQTVPVHLTPGAYAMLYGATPPPAKTGSFRSVDETTVTVPAQPAPQITLPASQPIVERAPAPAPRVTQAAVAAPAPAPTGGDDTCGASQYAGLVGGPVQAAVDADLPTPTRFYGSQEPIDTRTTPARLNIVVSTVDPAVALTNGGTVTRVFCG
ncbi:hypothetical protein [Pseudaestuariivita sp.]|uniref:hypothetical protein n=1 Tax=Pseudaestuariivita sp. TaxID=2211669 RepID=UPI0040593FC0